MIALRIIPRMITPNPDTKDSPTCVERMTIPIISCSGEAIAPANSRLRLKSV